MRHVDRQYFNLLDEVVDNYHYYKDSSRDNVGMYEIPDYKLKIDMGQGFPLLTTKKVSWKIAMHELIWMLSGSTNIDYLVKNKVHIWDKDAFDFSGGTEVGPIYGHQWRYWTDYDWESDSTSTVDQINDLLKGLKNNIYDRRRIVTAWNPAEVDSKIVALPPCHWAFQIMPNKRGFTLKWHQRSTDVFLGLPFDIALYAILGELISSIINVPFTELIGDLSCVHIYEPHMDKVITQRSRPGFSDRAVFHINEPIKDLDDLNADNFMVTNYKYNPALPAQLITKSYKNENR